MNSFIYQGFYFFFFSSQFLEFSLKLRARNGM